MKSIIKKLKHKVIIIGSGMAGLRAAVELAGSTDIAVISKVFPTRSHSGAAQGGITAALGNEGEDSPEWHMFDTVKGSDYLGDQDAIEIMVHDAPRAIIELEHMGVPFSRNSEGKIGQRPFGGHTRDYGKTPVKRACYASDRTGRVILDTLFEQCVKGGVKFYSEFQVIDLLFRDGRCYGAVIMELSTGEFYEIYANSILLATGGFGKIYKTTSNCFSNTGDAVSIVFQKGLPLQDMEFVQFHPTGIRKHGILISEAARGEGGILRNSKGERFMERYAPVIKDLAPRDIISRSILREIAQGRGIDGQDYVHLDLTHLDKETIEDKLWEITSFARLYGGVDPVKEMVPVQPTCHYMMGGIPTDCDGHVISDSKGTHVPGLFAAGECACVSVHGANRLGCNSLLDLVVFGRRAGKSIKTWLKEDSEHIEVNIESHIISKIDTLLSSKGKEKLSLIRQELQQIMTDNCSVFREETGLIKVKEKIKELKERYSHIAITGKDKIFNMELMEAVECEHLINLAAITVESALYRKESRGAHYREDYPERDDKNYLSHTLAFKDGDSIKIETKPVKITKFEPKARSY
jgi:succinate dehydrogenase / fumarate reductase flavoprotein subunit